jgi:hypothetical protein
MSRESVSMAIITAKAARYALSLVAVFVSQAAMAAQPIGQIKTETGNATVERGGVAKPAAIGDHVFQADTIVTTDGTVGITFVDNSMMSLGPNSRLSLDQFNFDTTTHNGVFNSSLQKGTLAVKSGQIVRQTPEAMHIRGSAGHSRNRGCGPRR